MQRPRITEIQVRMDCNGCVQKIKRALNGINGIYDLYIDLQQQKLIVVGWANPERIIKAIKKVRKVATICSHTEAPDPNSQPSETPPDGGAPPPDGAPGPDAGNPSPLEPTNSDQPPPGPPTQEPPNDQPPPQPLENQPNDQPLPQQTQENPPPPAADNQPRQPENHCRPRDVAEAHVIYHHPPNYGYRYGYSNSYDRGYNHNYGGQWSSHPGPESSFRHEQPPKPVYHEAIHPVYHERPHPIYHEPQLRTTYHEPPSRVIYHEQPQQHVYHEPPPQPVYHEPPPQPVCHEPPPSQHDCREPPPQSSHVIHSYNTYRPSPYITEYKYVRSPPQYTTYGRSPPQYTTYKQSPPQYNTYGQSDDYDMDRYVDPYRYGGASSSNGNVTSAFSDENPNACTIV